MDDNEKEVTSRYLLAVGAAGPVTGPPAPAASGRIQRAPKRMTADGKPLNKKGVQSLARAAAHRARKRLATGDRSGCQALVDIILGARETDPSYAWQMWRQLVKAVGASFAEELAVAAGGHPTLSTDEVTDELLNAVEEGLDDVAEAPPTAA